MENKRYWKSYEDLNNDPAFLQQVQNEKDVPTEEIFNDAFQSNRRDFLKFFGFTLGAATLTACAKTPVKYALPYVNNPTDLTPGIPNYYASNFFDGQDFMGVLVKTREGRPIKIEGNAQHPFTMSGVSARGQASVLGLYDGARLQDPQAKGQSTTWEKVDAVIPGLLAEVARSKKKIVVLTGTVISPSTKAAVAALAKEYATVEHVTYDAISSSGMLAANKQSFGKAVIPNYRFDNAEVIVGINADFLGTWLTPTRYTHQYAAGRRVSKEKKTMSRHYQFETNLSITGSNADYRMPIRPSQQGAVVLALYNAIAAKAGKATYNAPQLELAGNAISAAANDLWAKRGKALVVCGSQSAHTQTLVNAINEMLGSYGSTIDMAGHINLRQDVANEMAECISEMNAGNVGAVLVYGCNPAYTWHDAKGFETALGKVGLKVSFADRMDETAALCDYVLPDSHYLESWNDAEPMNGMVGLVQPTINTIFNTRQAQQSLLAWSGDKRSYYDFMRANWEKNIYPKAESKNGFENFWATTLHNGFAALDVNEKQPAFKGEVGVAANAVLQSAPVTGIELALYQKVGIGNGSMAQLPWLQELPDPISKAVWDNYVTINKKYADDNKLKTGDVVTVKIGDAEAIELPVYVQPGQARDTIGIALGYGRTHAGKAANGVGKNAYSLAPVIDGHWRCANTNVTITPTGKTYELALTQNHNTIMGRPIVKETTLGEYNKNPYSGNEEKFELLRNKNGEFITLWEKHEKNGHYWAMAIDLNACTGCGACVVSCQAENNIPVVGKDEVRRNREMHWIRIDRYYSWSGDATAQERETAAEFPDVVFQPMLCQHCDNAPCETVCPVLATTHSSEGLNQMTYNRCVGTRYCANNCPYKVRRFNWLDYANQDTYKTSEGRFLYNPAQDGELGRLVLNPDVTVRARGVMEKCSFCVQRLQVAKLEAKKEGRALRDGEANTACAQSCPAGAIVFGDLNDPNSAISKLYNTERNYHVLEELKTLSHISYMTKVRNRDEAPKPVTEPAEKEHA
jgi:molybdopterin-containing oxidoreductase family iron-sulfur binding subunit